jgi:hypothetical protein
LGVRRSGVHRCGSAVSDQRIEVVRCASRVQRQHVIWTVDSVLLHFAFCWAVLPTSIGGDAYRIYRILPLIEPRSRAVTSILLDRVIGLGALLFLGAVGAVYLLDHFELPQGYLSVLGLCVVGSLAGITAFYFGWFGALGKKFEGLKVVTAIRDDSKQLLHAGWRWLPLLAMAFVFQLTAIDIVYLLFLGAGSAIGFAEVP